MKKEIFMLLLRLSAAKNIATLLFKGKIMTCIHENDINQQPNQKINMKLQLLKYH